MDCFPKANVYLLNLKYAHRDSVTREAVMYTIKHW